MSDTRTCPRCGGIGTVPRLVTEVSNAPLRKAFLRSGLTPTQLAARAGWYERNRPNGSKVALCLGVKARAGREPREYVTRESALELAAALELAPFEVGL